MGFVSNIWSGLTPLSLWFGVMGDVILLVFAGFLEFADIKFISVKCCCFSAAVSSK